MQTAFRSVGAFVGAALLLAVFGCNSLTPPPAAPSAPVQSSPPPAPHQFTTDEYAALIDACGKASSFKDTPMPTQGKGTVQRDVKYPHILFRFMKTAKDRWTLLAAFFIHGDDVLDAHEVGNWMPCTNEVHFQLGLPN